ncbi:TonB-dependent receptor domain-containing protein [Sphingomonas lacusdianchii]|uniref:TonB-dependent receptor domain-containing protein n=1 Tax=Sphingomonas lacusdianchii TaxID=2917992 RepID=UPI001F581038|nr:TonB-dependent receptor [Sphingomonas sp. JXJ CY 53]
MNLHRLLGATALAGFALLPSFALAQAPTDDAGQRPADCIAGDSRAECQAAVDDTSEIITVTGSRIVRAANLDSANPIVSVSLQELTNNGNVSLGDALNTLPALGATYSSANSTRFIGTAGLSLLDLRRLGTTRTLVLQNGRRHITGTPGSFQVDINTIPVDLLDRVDTVTGGTSAVYGSDAIAGVVNFITKRDFEGVRLRGQGGVSDRGDRGAYFLSGTAGKNFADGRGNIAINAEYSFSDVLYNTDRDDLTGAYSGRSQFNAVENTGPNLNSSAGQIRGSESALGNGIPDQAFLFGVRNGNISEGGMFIAGCPTAAATGESAAAFAARRAAACSGIPAPTSANPLAQYGRAFGFLSDGTLQANNCLNDLRFTVASSNCVGGIGSTLRLTGMLQPRIERYGANVLAHFDVSDAFRPFVEAKWIRINSLQEGQPTFYNNSFSINNPYLSTQARNQLTSVLAPGATTFAAQRFNVDFGARGEDHRRDTYRIVGGVEGTFNTDWKYEMAVNYGRVETFYSTAGNVLQAQYSRSINAVRNSAGQIVCAVNADANTANDDAACVPVNLFGNGNVSQAALNYFGYTSTREEWADQLNATAYVSGNLGQLFELPGGPIGFAVGGEYRKERAYAAYDPTTAAGLTFLNAIPAFDPPAFVSKEAFAEVRVPLLSETFIHELSLEGAARYSDYSVGDIGGTWTWNLGGVFAPVRDVRLRAGYGSSVRAPTLGDLFTANVQTFANSFSDPCGRQNINNNPNRERNCTAAGVPLTQTFNGTTEPFTNVPTSGISGFNRGNPALREERSNSFTVGAVFQPRLLPGFSASFDYYNIRINDAINSLAGQTIINQCYDNPSGIDNEFCAVVFRRPDGTFAGQQNVTHAGGVVSLPLDGPSFFSQPFNYAKLEASGIDADIGYNTNLGGETRMTLRALVTYVIKRNNFTDIADPTFRTRQLSQVGDPQWRANVQTNFDFGVFDLNYQLQYVGKQTIGAFETQNAFDGRPAQNPDAFPFVYYPEIFYHNLRIGASVNDRFRLYGGIDNITDTLPPLGQQGTEAGSLWTNTGRYMYVGFEAKF